MATFCQVRDPPETVGAVGAVRSMRTVAWVVAETNPATSSAANRTKVWPCALTVTLAPAVAADQVTPLSTDV